MIARITAIVASIAMLGLLGVLYFNRSEPTERFASCEQMQVGGADIGGPFTLLDGDRAVTNEDVITGPALIYFGYSFCPDVCPLDNARNTAALDESGYAEDIKQVIITIDPERDTPERMEEYASYFSDDALGLSGSQEQIDEAVAAYRVYARKAGEGENYLMDHSTFTYLMTPEDGLIGMFPNNLPPDEMAESLSCYMEKL
ncbi:SCO family protein [Paracoccaceae bacterium GXU_MW_L88]